MTRALISMALCVGMAMPVTANAARTETSADAATQTEAPVDPRVHRLQTLYADAQAKVARFNDNGDPTHLHKAKNLLSTWLTEHRILYGDTPAALEVRAPVHQQLNAIEAQLAPPPQPVAQPVAPQPAQPAPQPVDSGDSAGRGLIGGGATLLSLGAAGVLGVAVPFWALRDQSLEEARNEQFHVHQEEELDRARRRQTTAVTMTAVGGSLMLAGTMMLVSGAIVRSRARKRQVSVAPTLAPGFAGASATIRF